MGILRNLPVVSPGKRRDICARGEADAGLTTICERCGLVVVPGRGGFGRAIRPDGSTCVWLPRHCLSSLRPEILSLAERLGLCKPAGVVWDASSE